MMHLHCNGRPHRPQIHPVIFLVFLVYALAAHAVQADDSVDTKSTMDQLRRQIVEIQQESQRKLEEIQRETNSRLQQLQNQISLLRDQLAASQSGAAAETGGEQRASREIPEPVVEMAGSPLSKLNLFGDFRLRYEANSSDGDLPSWDRGVLRARLGATYEISDELVLGGRLVTGDPDNPRTADVTIGHFDSDLEISLDQAYLAYRHERLFLTGGKFAKPFMSTELVWDGDVNPQGLGGYFDLLQSPEWSSRLGGLYFLINQSIVEDESSMAGGQLSLSHFPEDDWTVSLYSSYYDYDMGRLGPAAVERARGNNLGPDGMTLLSDFNLWDTIITANYSGFGDQWKVSLVGDYVKNLGAEVDQDTGYELDLYVGGLAQPGRFLVRYGYSQVETDAVLAMFSNDNIIYPTNYQLHTLSIDYVLSEHTFLGLTNYFYRHLHMPPDSAFENDWVSRTRLNFYVTF